MNKPVAASSQASLSASNTVSPQAATMPILLSLSFCHLLNDLIQSLIPALYPLLKAEFDLDFVQIGLITLAFQLTASLLQPTVGFYTDKRPQPYSLALGMGSTLIGLFSIYCLLKPSVYYSPNSTMCFNLCQAIL